MSEDTKPSAPARPRLRQQSIGVNAQFNQTWQVELAEGMTADDMFRPEFWSDVIYKFNGNKPESGRGFLDRIEVRQPSTGLYMALLITSIGKGYMNVRAIEAVTPEPVSIPAELPLTTRWNPGKKWHEVIRKAPQGTPIEVMASAFQTKADAAKWITDHYKKLQPMAA